MVKKISDREKLTVKIEELKSICKEFLFSLRKQTTREHDTEYFEVKDLENTYGNNRVQALGMFYDKAMDMSDPDSEILFLGIMIGLNPETHAFAKIESVELIACKSGLSEEQLKSAAYALIKGKLRDYLTSETYLSVNLDGKQLLKK